eukprot:1155806-Rhodomonas_salina.3
MLTPECAGRCVQAGSRADLEDVRDATATATGGSPSHHGDAAIHQDLEAALGLSEPNIMNHARRSRAELTSLGM